ncbi:MAG: hypothetical protein IJW38_05605 [Clostridia bacterium]|nr:hypothetical protein [Clostridia bacterium]
MYKYLTVCEKLFHEDIGNYTSYGIICINNETGAIVLKISDVSTERAFVLALAEKFTASSLSPCHFLEAVEDELE